MSRNKFTPDLCSLEGRVVLSPILTPIPTQFLQEGAILAIQVQATNSGQPISYSLGNTQTSFNTFSSPPPGVTINSTGLLLWSPPNISQTYHITVQATDSSGMASQSFIVHVFNNPPKIQAGINTTLIVNTLFTRTGSFTDPDPDQWTATVNYGDGTGTQVLSLNPDKTFSLSHTYTTTGSFTVSVIITDSQGSRGYGYFAVTTKQLLTPTPTPVQAPVQTPTQFKSPIFVPVIDTIIHTIFNLLRYRHHHHRVLHTHR